MQNNKNKFVASFPAAVLALAVFASWAQAAVVLAADSVSITNPLTKANDLPSLVNTLIKYGLGTIALLILAEFIYGGVNWMMSQGDATKIGKSRKMMIWSVLGLAVILASYAVLTLIFKAFGYAG